VAGGGKLEMQGVGLFPAFYTIPLSRFILNGKNIVVHVNMKGSQSPLPYPPPQQPTTPKQNYLSRQK
jgi:hypothetical protein